MGLNLTDELACLVLARVMHSHGIRKVIASPGTTNSSFVITLKRSQLFQIYSAVDERSAAYMACGMAAESEEPICITCTAATASRNYLPGLTEAYYRKLPILAITGTQPYSRVGHLVPQVIDRSDSPKDIARFRCHLPLVKDEDDLYECVNKANEAILELFRGGGGPVHINLPTKYSKKFNTPDLPNYKIVKRYFTGDNLPPIGDRKVAIVLGSSRTWSESTEADVDRFCGHFDAVVLCDHTSGYSGKYRLASALIASQKSLNLTEFKPDLTIQLGEISGDYSMQRLIGQEVWRVSEDGSFKDTFKRLTNIFEMNVGQFCRFYTDQVSEPRSSYRDVLRELDRMIRCKIPALPLSNIRVAQEISKSLPPYSSVHFGILNSLRSWNFFELDNGINSFSNVGGFGIDGCMSTAFGAALSNPTKIVYIFLGDLAFFYDMNVLGNRHLPKNLRVVLVNNGRGTEFRNHGHHTSHFGEEADEFIAAAGHFGNKSKSLVKEYVTSLGLKYFEASDLDELKSAIPIMCMQEAEQPMLLEVFTTTEDESEALRVIENLESDASGSFKKVAVKILGRDTAKKIKGMLK